MARLEVDSREDAAAIWKSERSPRRRVRRSAAALLTWRAAAPFGVAALGAGLVAGFAFVWGLPAGIPELAIIGTKDDEAYEPAEEPVAPHAAACAPSLTLNGIPYRRAGVAGEYVDAADLGPQIGVTTGSERDPCGHGEGNSVGLTPGRTIHEIPGFSPDYRVAVSFGPYAVVFQAPLHLAYGPGGSGAYRFDGLVESVSVALPYQRMGQQTRDSYVITDSRAVAALTQLIDRASPVSNGPTVGVGPLIDIELRLTGGSVIQFAHYDAGLDLLSHLQMPPEFEEILRAHLPERMEWPQ